MASARSTGPRRSSRPAGPRRSRARSGRPPKARPSTSACRSRRSLTAAAATRATPPTSAWRRAGADAARVHVPTADEIRALLALEAHPLEGGFFAETWRAKESVAVERRLGAGAPARVSRSAGTAIYYLLTPDTFSAMHRLPF